jgi:hypothetical protein
MKNIFSLFFFSFLLTILIQSCTKSNKNSKMNTMITLSKASVKRGEQVFAKADISNAIQLSSGI